MLTIKEIIKKLEEFDTDEDKLFYLKKLSEEIEDKDLIGQIEELIRGFELSLEDKLEDKFGDMELPPLRKIAREVDLSGAEQEVEQLQREVTGQRNQRPDLIIRQEEDHDNNFNYTSNNNYASANLYVAESFDYQILQNSFNSEIIKQNLVRENILNPEMPLTEMEKENLSKKLRETMPGLSPEQLLIYQSKISEDLRKDEKSKYIPRLK